MTQAWQDDILDGFSSCEIALADAALPEEGDAALVATLVRYDRSTDHRRAVVYLHGWNDYFFQVHLAQFWDQLGYAFYALDLRRYGRSLRSGQLPGYIYDLADYDPEILAAAKQIRASHEQLIITGHSTGGLIAALWVADHPGLVDAVVLNSPWLDLQATVMVKELGSPIIDVIGSRLPTTVLRIPATNFYARTIYRGEEGEWDYDRELKSASGAVVRVGWLRAVLKGHDRVANGLGITVPVLVLASQRSVLARRWSEDMRSADTVLDVAQIAGRAPSLGDTVTVERIEGGLHDLFLSPPAVREKVFTAIARWLTAYGPSPR